jgi:NAD(P)-dependent dehydrogenase (short-subunit alcohol dehydrogenase family)
MMRFKDKAVVVTGATTGIGRGTAVLFGQEGAKVVVAGRRKKNGEETVQRIKDKGGEAVFVASDISKAVDAKNLIETTVNMYGSIDVLVNNAGMPIVKPIHECTEEEWDTIIDTHMKGTFLCSKYTIPLMIKQGGGAIVNMGSIWSHTVFPGWGIYCAAKGGILLLTRAMAVDLAPYKIRVNCVCPGTIRTELMDKAVEGASDPAAALKVYEDLHPLRRIAEPEEVGKAVLFLASDDASWITGTDLSVDGGRRARDRSVHDIE